MLATFHRIVDWGSGAVGECYIIAKGLSYWRWPSFVVPYLMLLFSLFGGLGSVTLNRYVYNQTRSFVHVFYTIYKNVH